MNPSDAQKPIGRLEWLYAIACCVALLWINLYICRELFTSEMTPMNSMHGFWAAIARYADGSWFSANWWPYWDGGIPFEFTYAPLAPGLTAIAASVFHVSYLRAFQYVTAMAYGLAPVALFLMAWGLTRAPGYSFLAGLFYSLTSPTQILAPDGKFSWSTLWDSRRLYLVAVWDETPHVLALVFIPLAILFLALSIRKRRLIYCAAAAISIAGSTLASAFGPTIIAIAAFCLLFVLQRENYVQNLFLTIGIGAYGYALSAPFLPPSLLHAMRIASESSRGEIGLWSLAALTGFALVVLGWVVLWHYLPRWTSEWPLHFFVLFAWLVSGPPLLLLYLNRHLMPQPGRYKLEMEMALALVVIFAARCWLRRVPGSWKAALLFLYLALAGEQILSYRVWAKAAFGSGDPEKTIEYRAARWADQNLHDTRIMMPGSMAQWTNTATLVQQLSGGSWSIAYNPVQQQAVDAAIGSDAAGSLAWLKAYGVGAVCVSGPKSPEFWKPYGQPGKFEGILPVLWREDDTNIYQIPRRTQSFAHVVPQSAIVGIAHLREIERFDAALDNPSLPTADFQWQGRNRILIYTTAQPGQAVAIQINWHPGWHATAAGKQIKLRKDALGLTWLQPTARVPAKFNSTTTAAGNCGFYDGSATLPGSACSSCSRCDTSDRVNSGNKLITVDHNTREAHVVW